MKDKDGERDGFRGEEREKGEIWSDMKARGNMNITPWCGKERKKGNKEGAMQRKVGMVLISHCGDN